VGLGVLHRVGAEVGLDFFDSFHVSALGISKIRISNSELRMRECPCRQSPVFFILNSKFEFSKFRGLTAATPWYMSVLRSRLCRLERNPFAAHRARPCPRALG